MITTDSVCSLSGPLKEKSGISICPYYVCTDRGRFLDDIELRADEVLSYMAAGKSVSSLPPSVEDHEMFFAEKLSRYISSAVILDSTHMMCQSGRISRWVQVLCDGLLLHPILMLQNSRMMVGGMEEDDRAAMGEIFASGSFLSSRPLVFSHPPML